MSAACSRQIREKQGKVCKHWEDSLLTKPFTQQTSGTCLLTLLESLPILIFLSCIYLLSVQGSFVCMYVCEPHVLEVRKGYWIS